MRRLLSFVLILAASFAGAQTGGVRTVGLGAASGGSSTVTGADIAKAVSCTDAVGTDSYACSPVNCAPTLDANTPPVFVDVATANTGGATFAFCGAAAKNIVRSVTGSVSTALVTGDILARQILLLKYSVTNDNWQMLDPSAAALTSTLPGCSAITAIASVVNGTFTCAPGSVVNGSVSTAGRSILTIRDTAADSATGNFLNLTGTLLAAPTAEARGVMLDITGASTNQILTGLYISGPANTSGSGTSYGLRSTMKTGNGNVQYGVSGEATGGGGLTAGVYGQSNGTVQPRGVYGVANCSTGCTQGIGVMGWAASGTANTGGWFGLTSSYPTSGANSALIADNGAVAANIFEARDNGTAVFTIGDGGTTNIATDSSFWFGTSATAVNSRFLNNSAVTPDSMMMGTGSTSNSLHILESSDIGSDPQNACTTGLGTVSCTDPTLIIQSHNQDTGEFLSMAHDGKAGVIAGGNSTVLDGLIRVGGTVTLTESSATAVLTIPIPVSTGSGGFINYVVDARDATNVQVRTGNVSFAVANTSGGTETCNVFGIGPTTQAVGGNTTNPANPTEVQDGSGTGAITSGTLTYAWSVDTTGANSCVLKLNAVSSLVQSTLQVHYTVISTGPAIVTGG